MAFERVVFGLGLAVVLTTTAVWQLKPTSNAAASQKIAAALASPQIQASATTENSVVVVDLRQPCDLIVSSLGDPTQLYRIELDAHECEAKPAEATSVYHKTSVNPALQPKPRNQRNRLKNKNAVRSPEPLRFHTQRQFYLHVASTPLEDQTGYLPITGLLAAEGKAVRIYLDSELNSAQLSRGLTEEIIRLLEVEIIPRGNEWLEVVADVDGDGKLAILITAWLGKLNGGRTSIKGCVRANDFHPGVEAPFGNSADVIYLNAALEPGGNLKTILAHEYTHAQCFSQRFAAGNGILSIEDDWLNEAIAYVAERLHETDWSNLEDRVAAYLEAPERSPLAVIDYYRAGLWRDDGCRGATFLFLQFCVERFGYGLLRELTASPHSGTMNLEHATGVPFPELFRQWTIALAGNQINSLSLTDKMGSRNLRGLRRTDWKLNEGQCTLELRGTATSVVRLVATNGGFRRIICRAANGAKFQLTPLHLNP